MDSFGKSQSTTRTEDVRFLTGAGRYVDDITPEGALFLHVFRSSVAHADIDALDLSQARAAPGVVAVYDICDLDAGGVGRTIPSTIINNTDGTKAADPERPVLARNRVRFVGEPIAFIVAETQRQAQDAAELIGFDYTELPAHVDPVPGGPLLYDVPDNVAFDWSMGDADAVEAVFANAAHRVKLEVGDNRIIVMSMEPRGCTAQIEDGRLHVAVNGQGVWGTKENLSRLLGIDEEDVRVTTPDVGGGFGMKGMDYPETFMAAFAARDLDRPVRWMSDRSEAMQSDNAGRDLISTAEMAFDADHRILAYRVDTLANLGACNSQFAQPIQTRLFSKVAMGTYAVQDVHLRCRGIYTNTTQVDAYRGAGRPEAIYVLERTMDRAARELGVDPWELRRINFITPDAFPYVSATGESYDVGDFHKVLARVEDEADVAGFAARRADSDGKGLLRGLGLNYYIESILGAPTENAAVEFTADGRALIFVGTQSNGQGHETVYAKFLSDQTGIPMDRIEVVQGDSDRIAHGGGTGGSRSVTIQNTATLAAIGKMITGFSEFLADREGVEAAQVRFDDERFRVEGSNLAPTMLDVAEMARAEGREDLTRIDVTDVALDARSYPNGAHVAEVEIDPETGFVTVDRYTVVDDFGNLINPMLAEGQVHGGVAQGLGQALMEHVVHDDDGQLLTASLMDYAVPRAGEMPLIAFHSEPVPSIGNPMGMKGCGEAGTVGALGAISNAVQDALWPLGITQVDMPFTPLRVWGWLQDADRSRGTA